MTGGREVAREQSVLLLVRVKAFKNWRPTWWEDVGPVLVQHLPTCPGDCPGDEEHSYVAWDGVEVVADIADRLFHGGEPADGWYVKSVLQAVAP